jgi:transposase
MIRVVGVDDWAWSKGRSYGTILVDLERSEVTDLLPTRSADALCAWLTQHPEVAVVSRDRQGVYAEGASRGAPQALQVADRFHLMLNLRQAVERALAVQRRHLRLPAPSTPALPVTPRAETAQYRSSPSQFPSIVRKQRAEIARQRRQQKVELFQTIRQMKIAGLRVSQIAKQLGINRRRIDKWVLLDILPERSQIQPRPGMAESFREYLRQRWEAGCRHGRTLFAEIRELGYVGSFSTLAEFLSPWRYPSVEATAVIPVITALDGAGRHISPQVAAALLSTIRAKLTPQQVEIVDTLKEHCPGFAVMRKLVLGFRTLLRVGRLATLNRWMVQALKTGIHALERFVRTLQQDRGAVEAAVTEPWSNGPVEGHINRLKMLKRQMYGRAGVELLRARLLPEPVFSAQSLHQT